MKKTADEMFASLGYKLEFCRNDKKYVWYRKNNLTIDISEQGIRKDDDKTFVVPFLTKKELKAALKKLEEMGL